MVSLKNLLLQAKESFHNQQYQSAANDYLAVLKRLAMQLPAPLSQTTEAKKKREIYRQVQNWLCDCYLQLKAPHEVLKQLLPSAEYTSLDAYYLRARAYVLLEQIPEAIGELLYCQENDEQNYNSKWMESNLLLAVLYVQQHDTQAGYTQLQFCQNTLTRWHSNGSIKLINYLNFSLEIQQHLCQIHWINRNIDAAIQSLKDAHQLYLSINPDELANDGNVHPLLISIISQLFLLLAENKEWDTALALLDDLSLFENTARACETSAQAKALTTLLIYAKHSYESGNHSKAAEAFRISLHYMDSASRLENKSILVFSLVFAANFYLLPESYNAEFALLYIQLASKRLSYIPSEEQDIIHLELLLLQLAALQSQGDLDKSILCFNDLIVLYNKVKSNNPPKCELLLSSTLSLFSQPKLNVFREQINALAHELEKYQLERRSLEILSLLTIQEDMPLAPELETLSISAEKPICFSIITTPDSASQTPGQDTCSSPNKISYRK